MEPMKGNEMILDSLAIYQPNELIFASKFYKEYLQGKVKEATYYKGLERLCKSQELMNIAKGVYHLPKKSKYGIVPPSDQEIISAFIQNEKGMVVGYSLYNSLNLTTQISKSIQIISSNLEGYTKTIRNVTIQQVPIEFTQEIQNMIKGLEILQNFYEIQDLNYKVFIEFTETIALNYNEELFIREELYKRYKKSTIAFLREILNYYHKENNLDVYLSSLSDYKYPKMEELYAIARV